MAQVQLLSNGRYHVALTPSGQGRSHWNDLAITRWSEDAALGSGGTALGIRDVSGGPPWSAYDPQGFDARGLAATLRVAVARDDDVELRQLHIANRSDDAMSLRMTSYAELVLAPASTDAAHPAFNKLFIVTEIDPATTAVLATRRPSSPADPKVWMFHHAGVDGDADPPSFETDRACFLGRGRTLADARAFHDDAPLAGHAGPVLDPIAALSTLVRLGPGKSCTIEWTTGAADSRDDCLALVRRYRERGASARLLDSSDGFRRQTLQRLQASEADAALFERLAGALLVADPALRGAALSIARNRRGQSALWAYGISGDVPIVLVEVTSDEHLLSLAQLVQAHAFWQAHGLKSELLVLHAGADGAGASIGDRARDAIARAGGGEAIGKPGGIFEHELRTLDDGDRTLLQSAARIVVAAPGSTLADRCLSRAPGTAPPAPVARQDNSAGEPQSRARAELTAYNGHGGFSADGREYVIDGSRAVPTPLPWTNVIANPRFGTIVSESGSASTWSENAHEFRLTPWSNDPVSDPNAESLYIRDEETGAFWSPTLLPTSSGRPHVARHGFGYSVFEHEELGIQSTLRIHVAIDASVKFSTLTLRNRSERARRLSVTGCVDWVLGDERAKTLMHVVTEFDAASSAIFGRNGYNTDFSGRTAFFAVEGAADSACGDRSDFFGRGGRRAAPAALSQAHLSGRFGAALDPCAALRVGVALAPGQASDIVFKLGAAETYDAACALVRTSTGQSAATFAAVCSHWQHVLGAVQVKTPDASVNALINGWLPYQVIASRLWGRTAFYQSSGAYGFRDQLQDVMALVHCEPGLVREHLLRSAGRQFEQGDVQHWWHPPSGKGIRTRCSDDYLWLPFVTSRYVEVTDDVGVLDEACPFLQSRPLRDGEMSNYELPEVASESGSLYEHCRRAIVNSRRYGAHGLPLMGGGDWNDGMNQVGSGGKGESIWLAFFLIAVLNRFAPIARRRGDGAFADDCQRDAANLGAHIEASAWDGEWYLRAWSDDGAPIGSATSHECRIDSIAQSWSVLSGAAPADRARTAMRSLDEHLIHPETRICQLLDPPFDTTEPSPGYIQGYVPGVRENGGQYTHAAVWAALAFAAMGDGERAWRLFGFLDPIRHGDSPERIGVYKVEPYVVAGDVYAFAPHAGRGGWTWYTGSAGWMYQLLVESLLGLRRRGRRLSIEPLVPHDWAGFDIAYRFGTTSYDIAVRVVASAEAAGLIIDGNPSVERSIPLSDDGARHPVMLWVWRPDAAAPH